MQVVAHVRDALRMQKPLLLSAVRMGGPWPRQQALQGMVARYLARAISLGMPVAGEHERALPTRLPAGHLRMANSASTTSITMTCKVKLHLFFVPA